MTQPITPGNVIAGLSPLRWRGLEAPPYNVANFSGGHKQAEREYPYIDGVGHDNTGRKAVPMSFSLFFLNTLRDDLFPQLFGDWYQAFALDGTTGDLEHPYLGTIRARPLDWDVNMAAERTAGVIMNVTFTDTIENLDDVTRVAGVLDVHMDDVAAQADADLAALGIDYPTGERTDSLLDLVKQLESLAFSTRLTIQGMINQAVGIVDGLVDSVENIVDHRKWAAAVNLKALRNSMIDFANVLGASIRKTARREVTEDSTLDELARKFNNTVGEVMFLNPGLLKVSKAHAGDVVVVYVE